MINIGSFNEQGTGVFDCVFTDENGDSVTPDTVSWTITDSSGTVINEREQVEVESPDSTTTITIYGDDLKILESETGSYVARFIVIEGTYTSDLGSGLPTKDEAFFTVKNLHYVT